MSKSKANNIGIQVGPSAEAVSNIAATIMAILSVPHCDESTKQKALDVLLKATSMENSHNMISGCNIQMGKE